MILGSSSYGNELQASHRLFSLTPNFSEKVHFEDYLRCDLTKWQWRHDCQIHVNDVHRSSARLWQYEVDARDNRTAPDCSYTIMPNHWLWLTHSISYHFTLQATNCRQKNTGTIAFRGGTTFEIFAFNDYFLTSCSYIDRFDDSYNVTCSFLNGHHDQNKQAHPIAKSLNALQVTVLLIHEYLDSFSEVLTEVGANISPYVFSRRVLVDNMTMIFDHPHPSNRHNLTEEIPSRVRWYTASWPSKDWLYLHGVKGIEAVEEITAGTTYFGLSTYQSAYIYHVHSHRINELSVRIVFRRDSNHEGLSVPSTAVVDPKELSDRYVHRIHLFVDRDLPSNHGTATSPVHRTIKHEILSPMNKTFISKSHHYHFVGASHSRYYFDAAVEFTFGSKDSDAAMRKHQSASYGNFSYWFAREVSDVENAIGEICATAVTVASKQSPGHPNREFKIALEVGSWDLMQAGIRYFLKASMGLPVIFSTVELIVNTTTPCPGLTDLIWILGIPHPLHYDDLATMHRGRITRGYRFNPSIAAANEAVINYIKHLPLIASPIRVSIVDAFSIIKSRLAFNEDSEVACLDHFNCRVDYRGAVSSMIWTPGGKAVWDALWHALSTGTS